MKKDTILEIIDGLKILAVSDFNQLDEYEKDDSRDYQEGYLEALNMVYIHFNEKL